MEREALLVELEAAKAEQRRCMGGVDPVGCVAASKRITEVRNALRDDAVLIDHIGVTLAAAQEYVRSRRPRSRRRY